MERYFLVHLEGENPFAAFLAGLVNLFVLLPLHTGAIGFGLYTGYLFAQWFFS